MSDGAVEGISEGAVEGISESGELEGLKVVGRRVGL
jgi:hypothetical protein